MARAALPQIHSVKDIRDLTDAQTKIYLAGHGIVNPPELLHDCKIDLAIIIGCKTYGWYALRGLLLVNDRADLPSCRCHFDVIILMGSTVQR